MSTPYLPFSASNIIFVADHAPGHSFQSEQQTRRSSLTRRRSSCYSTKNGTMDTSDGYCSVMDSSASSSFVMDSSASSSVMDNSSHHSVSGTGIVGISRRRSIDNPETVTAANNKDAPKKPSRRSSVTASDRLPEKPERRSSIIRVVSHLDSATLVHKSALTF